MEFPPVQSVDIAICTWNRAGLLRQTLESLRLLAVPDSLPWRVLVVDNHSTDNTRQVLDELAGRLPLTILTEPQQGHTFARNRAVAETTADLVMWTDDDVIVSPDWVAATVAAAAEYPEAVFFGGPIQAVFQQGMPAWIEENWETLRGCFAERNLGPVTVELNHERLPFGANFSVRGDVQRRCLFSTELGRRGGEVLGEDEIELMKRLLDQGHSGVWVPQAAVQHVIDDSRTTPEFVRDYFVGQGRALVMKGRPWTETRWRLWCSENWHRLMYQLARGLAPSPTWLGHLARSALARGQRLQLKS